jgi:hypothetical protein
VGEILKMSDGVLQHAKLPSPVVPLSQQLRTLKLSSSGNPKVGTHYFVVSVIAPSQNLIPAVDPVATGVFINHMICVSWPGTTYISYTGLSTLDPAMFCRCIPPLNSLEHFRWCWQTPFEKHIAPGPQHELWPVVALLHLKPAARLCVPFNT